MLSITLNPGFPLLLAALLALVLPQRLRLVAMLAAAFLATALPFAPPFGAYARFAQLGLEVTPLRLDSLSQVFGLGFGLSSAILFLYSAGRKDRWEDAALLVHAGGAITAIYAGDLISFAAAAMLAALGGAGLVFAGRSETARRAGERYLAWQAVAGALIVAGAGFLLATTGSTAQGGGVAFDATDARTPGGILLLVGFLIAAGAPLAHVWVKDAIVAATPLGAAALASFGIKLAVYALTRSFPGEYALAVIGAIMALAPLVFAALEENLRRVLAYGIISQTGILLAVLGLGGPLAAAAVAAGAFTGGSALMLALMAVGAAETQIGSQRAGDMGGLARSMPLTALAALVGGLSAMAAPGFAGFASGAMMLDVAARSSDYVIWAAMAVALAGAVLHAGLKAPMAAFWGRDRGWRVAEAPFPQMLAMGLAAFFCVTIGLSPSWLFAMLPPSPMLFHPYDWQHLVAHGQRCLIAAAIFGALSVFRIGGVRRWMATRDVDAAIAHVGPLVLRDSLAVWGRLVALVEAAASGSTAMAATGAQRLASAFSPQAGGEARGLAGAVFTAALVLTLFYLLQN